MISTDRTRERILNAATQLFLQQGIKKTSMADVAGHAGLTRMTVYRYFDDRKSLAQAVFDAFLDVLKQAEERLQQDSDPKIEHYVDQIGTALMALPAGDFPALLRELSLVYPDIWTAYEEGRKASITAIFTRLLSSSSVRLRPGLQPEIVQTYFTTAVVNVLSSRDLSAGGLSAGQVFDTIRTIFLYGVLQDD